jgi:hypothetical protein
VLPSERVVLVPDAIDDVTAAAIMLKGMTAEYLARRCHRIEAGQVVVVHAAAGGVGQLLCQWARHLGATVIGVVGRPEKAALAWLELVNRELGRGGTYRSVMAAFEQSPTGRRELTRRAWYGVFARELGEGKWWQVAYDLDVSGVTVSSMELSVGGGTFGGAAQSRVVDERRGEQGARRPSVRTPRQAPRRHYEAWLDYVYYSSKGLRLVGYQESLSEEQAQLIYRDGDALPNAWHPSDHLPVGCVFQWADSNGSGPTV